MRLNARTRVWLSKTWIAVRFFCFGFVGFSLFFISSLDVIMAPRAAFMGWRLAIPLGGVGLLMALYGVGLWGQWGYLLAFLSFPLGCLSFRFLPSPDGAKEGLPFLSGAILAFIVSRLVRRFYQRRNVSP